MTEQEFREYLQKNAKYLEETSGYRWTPERIEATVQRVQETKRLRALGILKKEEFPE